MRRHSRFHTVALGVLFGLLACLGPSLPVSAPAPHPAPPATFIDPVAAMHRLGIDPASPAMPLQASGTSSPTPE